MKKKIFFISMIILSLAIADKISAQEIDIADSISRMDKAFARAEEEFTLLDNYYIGRAAAAHILELYQPYTAKPALTRYLNMICHSLALNSPAPEWYNGYHLLILDSPVLNAFSTPGGHIFITRGFVEAATSEDMLAAIIAHEIAHIQLQHGIKNIKHTRFVQDMQDASNTARASALAASAEKPGEQELLFQESVAGTIDTLLENGYSQAQELEADSRALVLLASAGYDPKSLGDLLKLLRRNQGRQAQGFGTTHPFPDQRISNIEKGVTNFWKPDTSSFRRGRFRENTK